MQQASEENSLHGYWYLKELLIHNSPLKLIFSDSVMFVQKKGEKLLPTGSQLGDLGNELEAYGPGTTISTYGSSGAKNYAYICKIKNSTGGYDYKEVRRLKGFTISHAVSKKTTLANLKDLIDGVRSEDKISLLDQIVRTKDYEIYTKDGSKILRNTFDKRIILKDGSYQSRPYGTVVSAPENKFILPEDYFPE